MAGRRRTSTSAKGASSEQFYPLWQNHKVFGRMPARRLYAAQAVAHLLLGVLSITFYLLSFVHHYSIATTGYISGLMALANVAIFVLVWGYVCILQARYKLVAQVLDALDGNACSSGDHRLVPAILPHSSGRYRYMCESCGKIWIKGKGWYES